MSTIKVDITWKGKSFNVALETTSGKGGYGAESILCSQPVLLPCLLVYLFRRSVTHCFLTLLFLNQK